METFGKLKAIMTSRPYMRLNKKVSIEVGVFKFLTGVADMNRIDAIVLFMNGRTPRVIANKEPNHQMFYSMQLCYTNDRDLEALINATDEAVDMSKDEFMEFHRHVWAK